MLNLSKLSLIALCVSLGLGLLPGIIAQIELLAPGLQVFPESDPGLYNAVTTLHAAALSQGLPLAAIALSIGLVTQCVRLPLLRIVGMLALVASPLAMLVMAWAGLSGEWDLYKRLHTSLSTYAGILIIANVTLAVAQPGARFILIALTSLSLLALGIGVLGTAILAAGPDLVLHDTYAAVSADHAVGVSVLLGAMTGVTGYIMQARAIRTVAASLIGGIVIALVGYLVMNFTLRAGLAGMPRGYVDYADGFAELLQALSIWTLVLAIAAAVAFGWILSNLRHKPPAGPEAEFD